MRRITMSSLLSSRAALYLHHHGLFLWHKRCTQWEKRLVFRDETCGALVVFFQSTQTLLWIHGKGHGSNVCVWNSLKQTWSLSNSSENPYKMWIFLLEDWLIISTSWKQQNSISFRAFLLSALLWSNSLHSCIFLGEMTATVAFLVSSLTSVEVSSSQPVVSTTFGLVVNFSAGNPCLSNAHRGRADGFKCFWPDGMNPQINWGREGAGCEDWNFSARQNYPQKV